MPSSSSLPLYRLTASAVLAAMLAASGTSAVAQSTEHAPGVPYFGPQDKFTEATGAEIYEHICQGCHMPGGKGAVGAGKYPALAANTNIAAKGYIVYTVLNGRKAMPPFALALSDAQIADVANYVRTHFGNNYTDLSTAAEVKAARPPVVAKANGASD